MPEQQQQPRPKRSSNLHVILFMIMLSFVCALVLSILASALREPQEIAKELDRSKQMMIAAKIFTHEGYFTMRDEQGNIVPAKYAEGSRLVPGTKEDIPTQDQILEVYRKRLVPFLVDDEGEITNFQQENIDIKQYITEYKEEGYYKQPYKLVYAILPNPEPDVEKPKPVGYIIPINGYGLWDAIYGYLALDTDGNTIIGISWYDQKETPGLGANIADAPWQSLFPGKMIFQQSPTGEFNPKTSPVGILVVKGKVEEVLGDVPRSNSAVDGMAGATLTGNGVVDAYKEVLNAYRPFLSRLQEEYKKTETS